jgi:transposase
LVDSRDMTESTMAEKHRRFTKEFKAEAVQLVLNQKQPVSRAAKDLGIWPASLQKWVDQARADRGDGKPGALTTEERTELAQLRREVRTLRMEREILKKATAFFAKENA